MIILGIETATQICGVAVTDDANLLGEYRLNLKNVHAERLVGAIKKLLDDLELVPHDLHGIAVSIGPGSFTGLRIGLSVAKGMAYALDLPLISIPTLEALAWQCPCDNGLVYAILRARSNYVYTAKYHKKESLVSLQDEITINRIDELQKQIKTGSFLIGETKEFINESIQNLKIQIIPEPYSLPSGLSIAILGTERFNRGETADIYATEPLYVQEFIAQKPKKIKNI